jgi:glycine oxidase
MSHVIVIGAGLAGLMAARELAAAGLRVTVLEQGTGDRSASWAAGGILSPLLPWREPPELQLLADWSQSVYPDLISDLSHRTGVDPDYVVSGLLLLGYHEDAAESWARQHGRTLTPVNRAEIDRLQPGLGAQFNQGYWLPDIAQVRNPRLLTALRESLQQEGVVMRTGSRVDSLQIQGHRCKGVALAGEMLTADAVVICAGAWSNRLLPQPVIRVQPVRGQMLAWQAPRGLLQRIVFHGGYYLIPRQDGLILAGSTLEDVGFDERVTRAAAEQITAAAGNLLPAIADRRYDHHWAGLRPATPDGLPYIGAHPGTEGLYVNTGHFRNGVLLAPAAARLLVDLLLQRDPFVPASPYAPGRNNGLE